jgi:prefoldin alpha subunit
MDQEIAYKMQMAYQQSQQFEEQLGIVNQQINELQQFEADLGALKNNDEKDFLASLGKGVFVPSEMKKDKLFVDVGAGFMVRKTPEEAQIVVAEQLKRLAEIQIHLQEHIEHLNVQLKEIMDKSEENK